MPDPRSASNRDHAVTGHGALDDAAMDDSVVARLDATRSTYRSLRYRGPTPDFDAVRRPAWGLRWAPAAAGLVAASLALVVSLIAMRDATIQTQPPTMTPPPIERADAGATPIASPVRDRVDEREPPAPLEESVESAESIASAPEPAVEPTAEPAVEPQSVDRPDAATSPSWRPRWTGPSASAGLGTIHRGLGRPTAPTRPLALTHRVPTRPSGPSTTDPRE